MPLRHTARGVLAAIAGLLATASLLAATTAPASAGQVGITVQIQGAGWVWVAEGTLDSGDAGECRRFDNQDHRVTVTCPRIRSEAPFEAWVWLRANAAQYPLANWRFDRWTGCDELRIRDGHHECGVHSGAFSSDERYPKAHFRDVVAPTVRDVVATQVPGEDRRFAVSFTSSDVDTTCRVQGVTDWAACTSGDRVTVPEGPHQLEVRATDPSGNTGAATVGVTSVDTRIVSGPSSSSRQAVASLGLRTTGGDSFWCSVDGAAYTRCGSGTEAVAVVGPLADGVHTVRVQARRDAWVDPVPATWRWEIDTVAPVTTLRSSIERTDATFTFETDGPAYHHCKLDTPAAEGSWTWCQSPATYSGLGQGSHTFAVKAIDWAGNEQPTPSVHRWTVDTVAPATTLVATTSAAQATFSFAAAGGATYACRLTTPAGPDGWETCTSPTSYTGLQAGQHVFEVRATDAAGNVEVAPATHAWTASTPTPTPTPTPVPSPVPAADTTPPETTLTTGPSGFVLAPTATFGMSSEPGATLRCFLDGASVTCGPTLSVTGLRSGTHTFTAAAVDAAGNVDPTPVVRTWTVPVAARDLRGVRGWVLRRTAAAYSGSRLESTRRGARVTHAVTGARSVALVVGKGRRHGTVQVHAGKRLLASVRLAAPRTAHRVVVPLHTFAAPYTGRLSIRVSTRGRHVHLEGLGVATG